MKNPQQSVPTDLGSLTLDEPDVQMGTLPLPTVHLSPASPNLPGAVSNSALTENSANSIRSAHMGQSRVSFDIPNGSSKRKVLVPVIAPHRASAYKQESSSMSVSAAGNTSKTVARDQVHRFELDTSQRSILEVPGIKMAKVGDGAKFKRRQSYQRQDGFLIRQKILNGGDSDAASSPHSADDVLSSIDHRVKRKTAHRRIPLWIQVCAMMMIPIAFVTVYLSMSLHTAIGERSYISDNGAILNQLIDCEHEFVEERAETIAYLVHTDNASKTEAQSRMELERTDVDDVCGALIGLSLNSKYGAIRGELQNDIRRMIGANRLLRFGVDREALTSREYRTRTRLLLTEVTNGVFIISRGHYDAEDLIELAYLLHAANYMDLCRSMAIEIGIVGVIADDEMSNELNAQCVQSVRRFMGMLRELARDFTVGLNRDWASDEGAQEAIAFTETLASYPPGVVVPWSVTHMSAVARPAIRRLAVMSEQLSAHLTSGEQEWQKVAEELAKLFGTLGVSLIGVLFVSRAQRLASARVEFALERTHKMSLAVQAFIPRSFLRLMAVESILNLERGDQTQVAVTMLFCDIRNFTGISENMSNEQLFEWLQAHLKRMTHATEVHRGFVSAYIGDAVSAIFLSPADACECAVRMQSVTDALCFELVAHNEDHMVRIGVGVHHALVGVGILGNDKHHSCAIVSSEVNVANQLEALTKEYGARIIVTAQVHNQLPKDAFESRPLGRVRLSATAAREYVLHEIFQADMPEAKAYKTATRDDWEEVLSLRETEQFCAADALLDEMEVTSAKYMVKDLAIAAKRAQGRTSVDVFGD